MFFNELYFFFFFFFSSRRRHTRFDCDWSSDVCSSDLLVAVCVGGVERREPTTRRRVWIRAVFEQDRRDFALAGRRGAVERMHSELVVGERVHVRVVLDEQQSRLGPVEEGRVVEGGEVVVRACLRQRRVRGQQLAQALCSAERRGLEDV